VSQKWLDDLDTGKKDAVGVVHEVVPDSPAAQAGIQVDDQMEYWEDFRLDSKKAWESKVKFIQIGDEVDIGIHRNHKDIRKRVLITGTLKARSGSRIIRSEGAIHTDN
jgi:S1-C subfamily serine protease